ncbi:MAG: sigma-54 dependent transcriptional regulator [Halioglobus sp.]
MTILIADDDASIRTSAALLLKSEGLASVGASSPAEALSALDEASIDLALVDMNYCQDTTSGMEGLELISALRERDENLPIVVMTGWASINLAVEAMRRGAVDFLEKPWKNERLLAIIRSQLNLRESRQKQRLLRAENRLLRKELGAGSSPVAESPAMQQLLASARRVAASDMPILITGENGTGKTLLAQYIHRYSHRADATLMTVNMGGIAEQVFESEMFGHVKGAFTDAGRERVGRVELAEGGTLFLDEIANTPISQQAKLLRLLEEHHYERLGSSRLRKADVRIVSATNADLDSLIEQQGFRRDLLFRLNGVTLHIPPLRERQEDIAALAQTFLEAALQRYDSQAAAFSTSALAAMRDYAWPGNIRELHHVVERSVLLCSGPEISAEDLQLAGNMSPSTGVRSGGDMERMTLEESERWLIEQAMKRHQGQAETVAEALGLSRSALYRRLEKFGLSD